MRCPTRSIHVLCLILCCHQSLLGSAPASPGQKPGVVTLLACPDVANPFDPSSGGCLEFPLGLGRAPRDGAWVVYAYDDRGHATNATSRWDAASQITPRPEWVPAGAIVLPERRIGSRRYLYIPRTGSLTALPDRNGSLPVPAGEELVIIESRANELRPSRAFAVSAGEQRSVPGPPTTRELVVRAVCGAACGRYLDAKGQRPTLRLRDGGTVTFPRVAGRLSKSGDVALFVFPAKANKAELEVDGRGWREIRMAITADDGVFPFTSVSVAPRAALTVQWRLMNPTLPAVGSQCSEASEPEAFEPEPSAAIRVMVCGGSPGQREFEVERRACKEVARRNVNLNDGHGTVSFDPIAPGTYLVEIAPFRAPPFGYVASVDFGNATSLNLLAEYFVISGKVSYANGQPFAGRVLFATGTAATRGNGGEYTAVLTSPPKRNKVAVKSCDGLLYFEFRPSKVLVPYSTFDIVIPTNSVLVTVLDETSRMPVSDALVTALVDDGNGVPFANAANSDEAGNAELAPLATDTQLLFCAEKSGYTRKCASPLQLAADEQRKLEIALRKNGEERGQIIASAPLRGGRIAWIGPDGSLLGTDTVSEDNTFAESPPARMASHLVVASRNLPLYVLPVPRPTEGRLRVPLPLASARRFNVQIARGDARLALQVGPVVVPEAIFAFHQTVRGAGINATAASSLEVSDIAETSPLFILWGFPELSTPAAVRDMDYFLLPEYRQALPRVPVVSNTVVLR
jgi:hypothetical protein